MTSIAQARAHAALGPRVHCNACDGTGQRSLTSVESHTLASVDATWSTTRAIGRRLGDRRPALTTLVMRLQHLVQLGLVQRRALVGNSYEWRTP